MSGVQNGPTYFQQWLDLISICGWQVSIFFSK